MNPKLQDCLSTDSFLREGLTYALVTKEETVATDATILVAHKTEELFGKAFAEQLPEDGILLCKETLKSISKASFFDISYDKATGLVKVVHSTKTTDAQAYYFPVKLNKADFNFPQYASLFDTKHKWDEPEVRIGINPKLFTKLTNAMGYNAMVSLTMTSPSAAIIVHNTESSMWPSAKGLIMPMMLDN